jgi:hypothetical protein
MCFESLRSRLPKDIAARYRARPKPAGTETHKAPATEEEIIAGTGLKSFI